MTSISSDINLPPRNAGRLNPLDHVPPVSNEKELYHVSVQVPIHEQSSLIFWQPAENPPVRFSDSLKEATPTWNLKPTHPFSVTEHNFRPWWKVIANALQRPGCWCAAHSGSQLPSTRQESFQSHLRPRRESLHLLFPACCPRPTAQQHWRWSTNPCGPYARTRGPTHTVSST